MIAVAVLYDTHHGKPSPDQIAQRAAVFSRTQGWAGIGAHDAHTYLTRVLDGDSLTESLGPEKPVLMAFVVTAGLLATSPKIRAGEWWFNYLDRVEARLEQN